MEGAIPAAEHKQHRDDSTTSDEASEDHVLHDPALDNEGSFLYRKRQLTMSNKSSSVVTYSADLNR